MQEKKTKTDISMDFSSHDAEVISQLFHFFKDFEHNSMILDLDVNAEVIESRIQTENVQTVN
jgi:hypothetical protein